MTSRSKTDHDAILRSASQTGDAKALRDALVAGARPDARSRLGMTALHQAAINGHRECVFLLLTISDPEAKDVFGNTALHCAAYHGHRECVSLLLPVSDPEANNMFGCTALHIAKENGHAGCAVLIEGFLLARQAERGMGASDPMSQSMGKKPKRRL